DRRRRRHGSGRARLPPVRRAGGPGGAARAELPALHLHRCRPRRVRLGRGGPADQGPTAPPRQRAGRLPVARRLVRGVARAPGRATQPAAHLHRPRRAAAGAGGRRRLRAARVDRARIGVGGAGPTRRRDRAGRPERPLRRSDRWGGVAPAGRGPRAPAGRRRDRRPGHERHRRGAALRHRSPGPAGGAHRGRRLGPRGARRRAADLATASVRSLDPAARRAPDRGGVRRGRGDRRLRPRSRRRRPRSGRRRLGGARRAGRRRRLRLAGGRGRRGHRPAEAPAARGRVRPPVGGVHGLLARRPSRPRL
ncbi:MAG: iron-chelator utilization protein, partial [uncultured Blastococcus sp.]